jgi:hypothetical protein
LFIVIAKASFTGNCRRSRTNGSSGLEGASVIRGMKTALPLALPVITYMNE